MESVRVAARCRPLQPPENGEAVCAVDASEQQIVLSGQRGFKFNKVYGPESQQEELYTDLVEPAISRLLDGYNVTVMAYGQTGAGKTYTMGTDPKVATGIIPRALEDIFHWESVDISISFYEVYVEEVYDLLADQPEKRPVIEFRAQGLKIVNVRTIEDARSIMRLGFKNRRMAATGANLRSSRSHAVCTIYVTAKQREGVRESKLNLIDLAGSESVCDMRGDRRREGLMINKGLYQLGNVMSALSSPAIDHIPYRNSTLTSVLRGSLTPHQYIILIACISPVSSDMSETISTLKFATRVSNIKSQPEAGLILQQRTPLFKTPFTPHKKLNCTIATPGRTSHHQRHPLWPINNTIDSPNQLRTPRGRTPGGKRKYPVTSTPSWAIAPNQKIEQQNEPEWSLNISSSTTVDGGFMKSSFQPHAEETHISDINPVSCKNSSVIPGGFSEDWFRTLIRDTVTEVVRKEIERTFSESRRPPVNHEDGASPAKKNRSLDADSSSPSIFNIHEGTVLTSSPNNQQFSSAADEQVKQVVRRSVRLSLANIMSGSEKKVHSPSFATVAIANKENVHSPSASEVQNEEASFPQYRCDQLFMTPASTREKQREEFPSHSLQRTVRRSTRLSMRGNSIGGKQHAKSLCAIVDKPLRCSSQISMANLPEKKQSKGRSHHMSTRMSMMALKEEDLGHDLSSNSRLSVMKSPHHSAQREHNNFILSILRSGNAKKLMSLPTVGPKTSTIICNHRLLHGPLESLAEIKNIRGLPASFQKRFLWANNVVFED